MKIRIACSLFVGVFLIPICLWAKSATPDWSVSFLDRVLAAVQPGQKTVQVDDMLIPVLNLQAWRNKLAGLPTPKSAFDGTTALWPDGNVYYTFEGDISSEKQKMFLDGVAEWALFANLHFIARTTQANYMTVVQTDFLNGEVLQGGVSAVGMVGGQQFLYLSSNAWYRAIVLHEVGHALGLVHEHQRSDRDLYLTIVTNNVEPGKLGALAKLTGTRNQGPYDFLSIMHYAQWSGSIDVAHLPTMVPLPPFKQFANIMGQGDPKLTPYDRAGMALMYGAAPALTNIVMNTQDSGPGSLRAALYYAYDNPGTTIQFNIPTNDPGFSNGVFTIRPTDILPSLFNATFLDGSTEPIPFNQSSPKIVLSGSLAQPPISGGNGLSIRGTNCTVRGLAITDFSGCGVLIYRGAQSNLVGGYIGTARNLISGNGLVGVKLSDTNTISNFIVGNYIGVNALGTGALSNGLSGIELVDGASYNTIGGIIRGAGNVISGNGSGGIFIGNSSGNVVQGNNIGLNAAGTAAIANNGTGIGLYGGAVSNLIGGQSAAARNIISGNGWSGLSLSDTNSTGNIIAGNYIGVNSAGSMAVPNNAPGIQMNSGVSKNSIIENLISGNNGGGIFIGGSSGNIVQGNTVGLNAAGSAAIANNGTGVGLYGGAVSNLIGGQSVDARNIISGNGWLGINLSDSNTTRNAIIGNYIGVDSTGSIVISNANSGIQLDNGTSSNSILRNLNSGNGGNGVSISGSGSSYNVVGGNIVGLDVTGMAPLGNNNFGIGLYAGAVSNLIGGLSPGNANLIGGNFRGGVELYDAATTNNTVRGNSIFANHGLGVALYGSANNNLSPPTLFSASLSTNSSIMGLIAGSPNSLYHADFYANPPPSGDLEAMTFLGSRDILTGSDGAANFSVIFGARIPAGRAITATITDLYGNTSSLSSGTVVTVMSSVHDGIPDAWRAAHFGGSGTTTNALSCATCDPDLDGMSNWQEFLAGSDPTNSASVLTLDALSPNDSNYVARFFSVQGVIYRVQYRDGLGTGFWLIAADQIVGTGTNIFIVDPAVASTPKRFYQVQVLW